MSVMLCCNSVPSHSMKRLPQHYVSLPVTSVDASGVTVTNYMDVVLGKNGFIWITSKCIDFGRCTSIIT